MGNKIGNQAVREKLELYVQLGKYARGETKDPPDMTLFHRDLTRELLVSKPDLLKEWAQICDESLRYYEEWAQDIARGQLSANKELAQADSMFLQMTDALLELLT